MVVLAAWELVVGFDCKWAWGVGSILYLDWDGCYNTQNCTPKVLCFAVCKCYLSLKKDTEVQIEKGIGMEKMKTLQETRVQQELVEEVG